MNEIDRMCAEVFLKEQGKLFDEPVAEDIEGAMEFLNDCFAQVFDSEKELRAYWREEGLDDEDMEDVTEALEVFVLPDGRYLYVEA
ncbi:MAG: glyoxalase [Lachnospiraceae bacterium]